MRTVLLLLHNQRRERRSSPLSHRAWRCFSPIAHRSSLIAMAFSFSSRGESENGKTIERNESGFRLIEQRIISNYPWLLFACASFSGAASSHSFIYISIGRSLGSRALANCTRSVFETHFHSALAGLRRQRTWHAIAHRYYRCLRCRRRRRRCLLEKMKTLFINLYFIHKIHLCVARAHQRCYVELRMLRRIDASLFAHRRYKSPL